MAEGARVDGRTARSQRTRAAIVDAHLSLLAGGDLKPTGERIADAAGVSLRTLWTNFKDMETLFAGGRRADHRAAGRRAQADRPDLPLAGAGRGLLRISGLGCWRSSPGGAGGGAARAVLACSLRINRTIQLDRSRQELEDVFGAELKAAGKNRDDLTNALLAVTTYASWGLWRDHLGPEPAGSSAHHDAGGVGAVRDLRVARVRIGLRATYAALGWNGLPTPVVHSRRRLSR